MDAGIKALIGLVPQLRGKEVAIEPLTGGLTNRNFRLKQGRSRFVARIAGENSELLGIDRATEHACAQAAFATGIGAEVIGFFPEHRALMTRFVPGTVLEGEDVRKPSVLRRIVASLRRYHEGTCKAGRFSVFETVRNYETLARQHQVPFPSEIIAARKRLAQIEKGVETGQSFCPCHNDLLPGNFVYDRRKVWILDWEYAGLGDRFFDLGNLAANSLFGEEDEARLLRYYFGQVRSDDLRRLRLMRLASDMREAMWGFLQMGISKLDFDYKDYAHRHLRRFLDRVTDQRILR